jgi:protein-arginine kinase activator protein McsA
MEVELKDALAQERFEDAGVLRDAINKLAEVNRKNQTKK